MNTPISLNKALHNPPPAKMWLPSEIRGRFVPFTEEILKRDDLVTRAQTEIDTWCASTREFLGEFFNPQETASARIFILPCFEAAMLFPENYPIAERAAMATTGYAYHLPSERFAQLITKSNEEMLEPMIMVFCDSKDGFLRGYRWPTMNLFWCPKRKRVLSSISLFWDMDDYLMCSQVAAIVDDWSSDSGEGDIILLRSAISASSRTRLVKQDILRAIDSFDVLARYGQHDEKVEATLRQCVMNVLRKNDASEVVSWFETAHFPMGSADIAALYDILELSSGDRDALDAFGVSRDSGEISRNETIFLSSNFVASCYVEVEPDSETVYWEDSEIYALDDCVPEDFWLDLVPRHEEVDLAGVLGFMNGLRPAVRILDEDPNAWSELIVLAQEFAQELRAKSA